MCFGQNAGRQVRKFIVCSSVRGNSRFYQSIADKVYENQEDHIVCFNDFVTHTLDFKDLYTSGHWDQVLHHLVMMNIQSDKGEQVFAERLDVVLSRMNQDDILTAFAEKAVPLMVQKGKDELLSPIKAHYICPPTYSILL